MERCVADVKAKGGNVNSYAVCRASIMGDSIKEKVVKRAKEKLSK